MQNQQCHEVVRQRRNSLHHNNLRRGHQCRLSSQIRPPRQLAVRIIIVVFERTELLSPGSQFLRKRVSIHTVHSVDLPAHRYDDPNTVGVPVLPVLVLALAVRERLV